MSRQKPFRFGVLLLLMAFLPPVSTPLRSQVQFQVGLAMPFENQTEDASLDWIGEGIAETLTSDLASPRFLMIGRRQRVSGFDQLGMVPSRILSNATIYKVADALDANQVIVGSYEYRDEVFSMTARVIDMQGPRLSRSFTESGPLAKLLDLQAGLAWQLQLFLRPAYPLSKEEYLTARTPPRLDAFENYLRGVSSKDKMQQIEYFRAAQRLDPDYTRPAFDLGMIYFEDRDYPTSVLWLSKLRRSDPDYLEANYFLGLAYLHQENFEQAAVVFRVVEQKLPLNEVFNNLGIAMARQDRPGAVNYFEKAVQSEPSDPDYQFNLGYALWKRGNFTEAREHLQAALQNLKENDQPIWRALYIECLKKLAEVEEARRQARLLPADTSPDKLKFENLERAKDDYDGSSFRQLRILVQLREELRHSKLPLREHATLHLHEAQEYLKDRMERQAVNELELVMEYDPEDSRAYLEMADIHMRAGRLEDAARLADHALSLDRSLDGYLLQARILLAQGQTEGARTAVEEVLQLDPSNSSAAALQEELNKLVTSR